MFRDAMTTWRLLRSARASSRLSVKWFRLRQEAGLRRLLVHAYTNVPLYRRLYDEAGFRPDLFRTLDDLPRVPPLTKAALKAARGSEAVAHGVDPATCRVVSTSGSTGAPLQIVQGRFERCWNRAVAWRILFEHGFRWTDRTLEIRMKPGTSYGLQRLGIAPKDWLSIMTPPDEWARQLMHYRHACVVAGAGTLELLADALAGQRVRAPRVLISDSEPLTPRARARVRDALGTDPVDVYGLEEVSNFAWECERHEGLHVSADSHVVEIAAPPGETGPLLVTALGMWTMPIIRYETGDLAAWSPAPCACGRTLPVLSTLHGRSVDSIVTGDGRHLLWPFFHELLGAEPDILRWQVRQQTRSHIVVHTVLRDPAPSAAASVEARLRLHLPPGLHIDVRPVADIPLEANGKRRLVVPLP
jgi:phenylacetate-CoA ligase